MKKGKTILLVVLLTLTFCGCTSVDSVDTNSGSSGEAYVLPNKPDSEDSEAEDSEEISLDEPEETSIYEYTDDEKTQLSFEADKIVISIGFDAEKWMEDGTLDDFTALKNLYPDIELVNSELIDESDRRERWYSETTGLTYDIEFFFSSNNDHENNLMYTITGQAKALFSGLIAPIKVDELMSAVGIPKSEWAIGEGPKSKVFSGEPGEDGNLRPRYVASAFGWNSESKQTYIEPDNICLLVLNTNNDYFEEPIAITITPSLPGYISPADKIEIRTANAF